VDPSFLYKLFYLHSLTQIFSCNVEVVAFSIIQQYFDAE